jgi:hypothetical protein
MEHVDLKTLQNLTLSQAEFPDELLLSQEGRYATYYAPFEFVNTSAKIVICGITPGVQQALIAIKTAKKSLQAGLSNAETLQRAKYAASFAGAMRRNLTDMLNFIGLHQWLGLETCGDLFETRQDLVHFTSALQNPVLDQGQNFSGGSAMVSNTYLWNQIREGLKKEIEALPTDCVFIPLGRGVDSVFEKLANEGLIESRRVLYGLPHASGANAERIAYFCQRKDRALLSNKTNPARLDESRTRLLIRVAELTGNLPPEQSMKESQIVPKAYTSDYSATKPEPKRGIAEGKIKRIYATGKVKGKTTVFTARHNNSGKFVLNRKTTSPTNGNTTNRAKNKVLVSTLQEAATLLASGEYLINLVTDKGIRGLRSHTAVIVEREQ